MPKTRILFEAGPMLDSRKTGVGYYVNHLIISLNSIYGDNLELTGYYFNFLRRNPHKAPPNAAVKFHEVRFIPGKLLSLCRRLHFQPFLEIFIQQRADIVMFTNFVALPLLSNRKIVLVVYDTSFLDVPEYTQSVNLAFMKRFSPPSIRRADMIITISEFTKTRLEYYFPDIKSDIIVTPVPPAKATITPTGLTDNLLDRGLLKQSYILYLGTIEPRKNLEALVTAYTLLDPALRAQYSLVLAGGKGWKDEAILAGVAAAQAQGMNIILTGYISDMEKSALYTNAACFVMPSHYEGFGMPILEAMQYGIPVVLSNIPVFREVAGNAAVFFDKDNARDIAAKIAHVLTDSTLTERLVHQSNQRLKTFSWQTNAQAVFEAVQRLIAN